MHRPLPFTTIMGIDVAYNVFYFLITFYGVILGTYRFHFYFVCVQFFVFLKKIPSCFHPKFLEVFSIFGCYLIIFWLWYFFHYLLFNSFHTEMLLDGEPIINIPPKTIQLSKIDFTKEERAFYLYLEESSRQKLKVVSSLHSQFSLCCILPISRQKLSPSPCCLTW